VEVENPPPELYAVEEPYRRIVEEVAIYVAERGRLEREKYNEIYRRFRELYPLPSQLIQQAMNQGVETGRSFLQRKKDGRVHKTPPRGGAGFDKIRQKQLELQESHQLCSPRPAGAIPPRREEGGLDKASQEVLAVLVEDAEERGRARLHADSEAAEGQVVRRLRL
jgi:hypothetical protein